MADGARAQRAAALEEKKRRLEELKARRNRRGEDEAGVGIAKASNLDEYIDGLLNSTTAPAAKVPASENGTETPAESELSIETTDADGNTESTATFATDNVIAVAAPPAAAHHAPVRHVETFAIATQTEEDDFPPGSEADEEPPEDLPDLDAIPPNDNITTADEQSHQPQQQPKILTPEELEKEVSSAPFSSFLNTASKKVERLLGTPVLADLFVNNVGESDGTSASTASAATNDGSRFLSARQVYECPRWTSNRDVTDMDWSPLHRELMLCSYHMSSSSSQSSSTWSAVSPHDTSSASLTPRSGELQSDGLALVWSLAMPNRPEHIFTCGSPILTTKFHPTEAPLVLGGCVSGQLVLWDVRAGRLPVQRSSPKAHVHPICSMHIIEGGSGLVTAASDGKVNFWSLASLRDPAESLQVDGNIACMAVAPESQALVGGDEQGALHFVSPKAARRPPRKTAAAGHFGMVTSVSTKLTGGGTLAKSGFVRGGAGGLVLSSGVDWTVQLWAPAFSDQPLWSWVSHSYDYMCDVQWNPTHPSLFATASSNGSVGLWNLASSLEEPMTGTEGIVVDASRGLNKVRWSADGRRMIVASGDQVHVLSLSEEALRQKGDDEARMMNHLASRGVLDGY